MACWLIHLYVRLIDRTGRWRVVNDEIVSRFVAAGKPFVCVFWHGRLLMLPIVWGRRGPFRMLISDHPDGRIIAGAVAYFGIDWLVRPRDERGSGALRAIVKRLNAGDYIGITPDGSRGPAMKANMGAVAAARLARVPIVPVTFSTRRRRILGTWDRFHFAWPWTEGIYIWGEPIEVPADADAAAMEAARVRVEQSLNAITAEADTLMGHQPLT